MTRDRAVATVVVLLVAAALAPIPSAAVTALLAVAAAIALVAASSATTAVSAAAFRLGVVMLPLWFVTALARVAPAAVVELLPVLQSWHSIPVAAGVFVLALLAFSAARTIEDVLLVDIVVSAGATILLFAPPADTLGGQLPYWAALILLGTALLVAHGIAKAITRGWGAVSLIVLVVIPFAFAVLASTLAVASGQSLPPSFFSFLRHYLFPVAAVPIAGAALIGALSSRFGVHYSKVPEK